MNINELLSLFEKWCKRRETELPNILLYSDGSGTLTPKDCYQPIFEFYNIEELIKLLEE